MKTSKKRWLIVFLLLLGLALVACGGSDEPAPAEEEDV
jgi:hypothetical protein